MNKYERIFSKISEKEPPSRLFGVILQNIENRRNRMEKIRKSFFGAMAFISAFAGFFAFKFVVSEFGHSAFFEYFSLIFSDTALITAYWREFVSILAESLPVFGLVAFSAALFSFFGSLFLSLKNSRITFFRNSFYSLTI